MITVRVELEATGVVGVNNKYAHDSFETEINLSFDEAKKYYDGNVFNMGLWYDSAGHEHEDNLMRVTSCVLLN